MHKLLVLLKRIAINLDWFIAILLSFVFSILGIFGLFSTNVIFATTLLVLAILSASALRDRFTLEKRASEVSELVTIGSNMLQSNQLLSDGISTGISRVFPRAHYFNWIPYINEAKHVTIVSIKHAYFLWGTYTEALEALLERGGTVTLVIGDPRSSRLWLRYQEERTDLYSSPGWDEDLAKISRRLYEWRQSMSHKGHEFSRLLIKVFHNYPTGAFFKFDDRIFTYHYYYLQQGYDAPMFLFSDPKTSIYQFLNQCIESLVSSSVLLGDVIDDIWEKYEDRYFSDENILQSEIIAVHKDKNK